MTSEDDHDAAYLAAIRASERLRADRQKAAEQAFFDVTDQAYADHAARDRAYAIASDGRQGVYDRAAQDHFDRVAATQRHFGQAIRAHGNPDAPHAQAWLATLDVEAFRADPEPSPIGSPAIVEHHPGMPVARRIDERGIIVAEPFTPGDGGRGTFCGDAASAKRAGVMTRREQAEAEAWLAAQKAGPTFAPSQTTTAVMPAPEPPPGLVADIQAALARTTRCGDPRGIDTDLRSKSS